MPARVPATLHRELARAEADRPRPGILRQAPHRAVNYPETLQDGKAYAVEGTLQGYHCPRCALEFFLNDIPETSPASPEPVA